MEKKNDDIRVMVSVVDLVKEFGSLRAVDSISFTVNEGEIFGILGPNGAGKTTTIRMIYGFSPITDGKITIFGLDTATDIRAVKERIGICQQEDNLDPDLSALTNLEVFARYFNLPKKVRMERAHRLLKFVSLEGKAGAKTTELSGGMKRRLILARSLVNEPDLLILDEPTTGLDPQSRHVTWDLLMELRARGKGILLTTHYMDEAERLCDRLVIMDHGKILIEGKPRDLIRGITGGNVMEIAQPSREVEEKIRQASKSVENLPNRLVAYGDGLHDVFTEIAPLCPQGCTLRPATLEDVFLKLTGRELKE